MSLLTFTAFLLPLLCLTDALNLDSLSPTTVGSGLPSNTEEFGWTLTQHVFSDGSKSVLVSAPKANGSVPEEGGVYSCPFDVGATCQFQPRFQSRTVNKDSPFETDLQSEPEKFEGQLLGYSLKSSGNVVIACAPLYVGVLELLQTQYPEEYKRGDPIGRCIVLNSDLNTTAQVYGGRIGSSNLAGLDVEIVEINGNDGFLLSNTFAGTGPNGGQLILSNRVTSDGITSDERTISPTVPLDSFYGFHLEMGQFTQNGSPQVAVSAPRSGNHFGKVEILDVSNLAAGPVQPVLLGEEADGYFGYDFAVMDLDQQGFNALAVGCPLCARERGRVYVYANLGSSDAALARSRSVISSPSFERGRFGLAVANIGDIDLDGLSDIAVSAPYDADGRGRVYIYRGSESGVVLQSYQSIDAVGETAAFGFSLSGGLDVDNNGYPDITVGDLQSGRVTSIRGAPVVNVTLVVPDRKDSLDITGNSDRLCPLNGIMLQCFNITPCFYYEPRLGDVPHFALSYSLAVDEEKARVSTYSVSPGGVVRTARAVTSGEVNITGQGSGNMVCAETVTFALSASFVDTDSIPVTLSVDNAPELLALEPESNLRQFGSPLHPVLMKYTRGDVPAPITLQYQIESNVDCSFGNATVCEGTFSLDISEIRAKMVGESLLLASSNEFSYTLNVTNTAEDTAVNPTLVIQLPQQTRLIRTEPAVMCYPLAESSSGSIFECALKNPMSAGESVTVETFFGFNDTSALLELRQLEISFFVRDGGTGLVSQSVTRAFGLEALGVYELASRGAQSEYKAFRSAVVFPNTSLLALDQLGPLVTIRVVAQNILDTSTGSAFPRSTLYIHLPSEVLVGGEEGEESASRPLLVPFSVAVSDQGGNVNCSHFNALPVGLSSIQQPEDFLPPWQGPRPPEDTECKGNGTFRCGIILCTVFDLQPLPQPPTTITVFARLYSPSVSVTKKRVGIYSRITSNTDLPRIGNNSVDSSLVTFALLPGAREVQRECIRYWVVVVSVVIGIFAVVIIILLLALCNVLYRWYKHHRNESTGDEQTDHELSYQRRTIPPISQLTNGTPSSPQHSDDIKGTTIEHEKEAEAQLELEGELQMMATLDSPESPFDPSAGLDQENFEGMETDL